MIQKPNGYDNAPIYGTGSAETVTPGGHICQIRAAREETTNGARQLVIAFDLSPDDAQAGFYQRQYAQRVQSDVNARWPGVHRQGIDGKGTPFFKGLITAIEESNPGYTWNWDETTLKGKLFGGVFGREEYIGTDGKPHWSCKIRHVRGVAHVLEAPAPDDRPLAPGAAQAGNAQSATAQSQYADLPF